MSYGKTARLQELGISALQLPRFTIFLNIKQVEEEGLLP